MTECVSESRGFARRIYVSLRVATYRDNVREEGERAAGGGGRMRKVPDAFQRDGTVAIAVAVGRGWFWFWVLGLRRAAGGGWWVVSDLLLGCGVSVSVSEAGEKKEGEEGAGVGLAVGRSVGSGGNGNGLGGNFGWEKGRRFGSVFFSF